MRNHKVPNIGDRVIVGDQMFGTVEKVASDGEVKVLLDDDTVGMYYPASGVAEIEEMTQEVYDAY
jgi:preprotein translocase subunit YajC